MTIDEDDLVYDPEREPLDNIARALFACASALEGIRVQVKYLGVGDAASTMGAIEFLGTQVREGAAAVESALDRHAEAVQGIGT